MSRRDMRRYLTPDLIPLAIMAGGITFCAGTWCWMLVDQHRHPTAWDLAS